MRTLVAVALTLALGATLAMAQGQAPQGPPTPTTAPAIAGVVAAGTTVHVIKDGLQGTEGPITLPDGSLIFTETNASRVTRIDANDQMTTFLENTNGSNSLAFDSRGRLMSVQTTPGQTRIGIIYPKGSEAVLADNVDGRPIGRPNDLTVDKRGGVYLSDPGANRPPRLTRTGAARRLLHSAWWQGHQGGRRHRAPERRAAERRRESAVRGKHGG